MDMDLMDLRILNQIGRFPYQSRDEIAEKCHRSKNSIVQKIYQYREHGFIVKAPEKDKPLKWEITGRGKGKFEKEYNNLLKDFLTQIDSQATPSDKFHVFIPLGKRNEIYNLRLKRKLKSFRKQIDESSH